MDVLFGDVRTVRETGSMQLPSPVVAFARSRGVEVESPVLLRSTNNVVAWLAPSTVVAKVAVNSDRAYDELLAAQILTTQGAPVIAPARGLGDQVHRIDGNDVTFWTYVAPVPTPPTSRAVASALAALHDNMRTLVSHRELRLRACRQLLLDTLVALDRDSFAPSLAADDRTVLKGALANGLSALVDQQRWQPIHGSPHRFNIVVDDAPRFIDFETIAVGPVEWDLAHLEPQVAESYHGHVDDRLLSILRIAINALTSAQCWHAIDRGPDMIDHATHHLDIVRGRTGSNRE